MSDQDLDFLPFIYNEELYQIEKAATESILVEPEITSEVQSGVDENVASNKVEEPVAAYAEPQKEVLVLFESKNQEALAVADADYLKKILAAVKLTKEQVDLVNVCQKTDYQPNKYKKILSFTASHHIEGVAETYSIQSVGEAKVVVADDLHTLAASPELRRKLWATLKAMFE